MAVEDPATNAIQAVRQRALGSKDSDRARLSSAFEGVSPSDDLAASVRRIARLTLNFHPDRLTAERESVATGLLRTGRYLPQHLTGLSNGMRFAPGGDRVRWEAGLFADAYRDVGRADSMVAPVYGALDVLNDPFGGAPRFGSSFVVLDSACFDRTTFCVGDSHVGPSDVGTIDAFDAILAGLFESDKYDEIVAALHGDPSRSAPARELDRYVEIQVHGGVDLSTDVAAVVLDPSFRNTDVHRDLLNAGEAFGFALDWHEGSTLAIEAVPSDFRGPSMPVLAQRAAPDGVLDPAAIGRSLASVPFTPPSPDGDPSDGPLQQHKYLWHCLLRFGTPAAT